MANEASGQSRARAGVRTWPVERARRAFGAVLPGVEFAFPARLREWAAQEVAAGRLLPWFAVSFGAGIVLYASHDAFYTVQEWLGWARFHAYDSLIEQIAHKIMALTRGEPISGIVDVKRGY